MSNDSNLPIQGVTESGKIRSGSLTESGKIRAGFHGLPTQQLPPVRPTDTSDHINLSDEALEEQTPVRSVGAPGAAAGLGVPGMGSGGVVNSLSGVSGFGKPGIQSGGVIVSGASPDNSVFS